MRVGLEAAELGAALQVPEAQGSVISAGNRMSTIGRYRDSSDPTLLAPEAAELRTALQIPEAQGRINRGGKGAPPV